MMPSGGELSSMSALEEATVFSIKTQGTFAIYKIRNT